MAFLLWWLHQFLTQGIPLGAYHSKKKKKKYSTDASLTGWSAASFWTLGRASSHSADKLLGDDASASGIKVLSLRTEGFSSSESKTECDCCS